MTLQIQKNIDRFFGARVNRNSNKLWVDVIVQVVILASACIGYLVLFIRDVFFGGGLVAFAWLLFALLLGAFLALYLRGFSGRILGWASYLSLFLMFFFTHSLSGWSSVMFGLAGFSLLFSSLSFIGKGAYWMVMVQVLLTAFWPVLFLPYVRLLMPSSTYFLENLIAIFAFTLFAILVLAKFFYQIRGSLSKTDLIQKLTAQKKNQVDSLNKVNLELEEKREALRKVSDDLVQRELRIAELRQELAKKKNGS